MRRVQESDQLIMDTVHMNAEAVALQIEKVHLEATNPLNAHNENALRAAFLKRYGMSMSEYRRNASSATGNPAEHFV